MSQLLAWMPQLAVTALPGLINIWLSAPEQRKRFQEIPVFNPSRSRLLWLLWIFQFLMPAALFWWVAPEVFRIDPPTITRAVDFGLVCSAIAFGWGFGSLLNAPISILSAGLLDFNPIYSLFVSGIYEKILRDQKRVMRTFWEELTEELATTPTFSYRGFNHLIDCFGIPFICLTENCPDLDEQKAEILRKIKAMQDTTQTQREKAEAIVRLLRAEQTLNKGDWPDLIKAFGGRKQYIPTLFSKSNSK